MSFLMLARRRGVSIRAAARLSTEEHGSKINKMIPVYEEGKKITDRLTLKEGDRVVLCRCWLSKKWPICDGSHGPHNRSTGDNVGPVVITVGEQE